MVRERALANIGTSESEIGDAVLANPQMLANLFEELVGEAQSDGASSRVISSLQRAASSVRRGMQNAGRYPYTLDTLASLQGMSSSQMEGALRDAIEQASDDRNRRLLERGLRAMENPRDPSTEQICAFCCFMSCFACGPYCVACCIAACVICETFGEL
jgi:hypothetical protein